MFQFKKLKFKKIIIIMVIKFSQFSLIRWKNNDINCYKNRGGNRETCL